MRVGLFVMTYNRSTMLCEMLNSIQLQSYSDFECIVLDNGSSDDTLTIFKDRFSSDPRFKIQSWTPRSSEENFQRAINLGREQFDWFAMLHDDDLLLPDWLQSGITAIKKNSDANMISINARAFESATSKTLHHWYPVGNSFIRLETASQLAQWIMKYGSMNFPSILYSKNSFSAGFLVHNPYGKVSDQYLILEAGKAGVVIVVTRPAYEYRIHAKQDSSSLPENDVYAMCEYVADHIPWRRNLLFRLKRNSFLLRNYIHFRKLKNDANLYGWLRFLASRKALLLSPWDIGRITLMLWFRFIKRQG